MHDVVRSRGEPLNPAVRAYMEPRFGRDFSAVRVHNDARAAQSARDIDALAYTRGANIVFGAGQFAPETPSGRRLIAHELTHVTQQHVGHSQTNREANGGTIQRQTTRDEGSFGGGEFGGGGASGSWDAADIELVRMSCESNVIDFHHSSGSVTRYKLTDCDLTEGEYDAEVTVDSKRKTVVFDIGGDGPQRVRFRFRYWIQSGQPNPITFFRRQSRVRIVVGPVPPSGQTTRPASGGKSAGKRTIAPPLICSRPLAVRGLRKFRHAFVHDPPSNY
ncbi:MAG: DUF4157 domain-containing protein, partial [Steroidobacteraceae bacterium]